MEEISAKKRTSQHLLPNEENDNNPPKRKKHYNNEDNLKLYVKFLSELTDTQKAIVRKIGFGSLLQISCDCNIDDIFMWLALHFNTATCSLELRNGFSFEFNTSVVHKILGIPSGGLPIISTPTKECLDIISNLVQTSAPSTEHLISMITDNISEENFSTIFLLLTVSCLIAPNAKGSPSKKFYTAVQSINCVGKYNWCLSALSYLVHQIEKIKSAQHQNKAFYPGGCKLILVVAHFEFLITSEFKFPIDILPRLPLWSSSLLKTFTALDTMHSIDLQFGRLPLKHISSTPFNNTSNEGKHKLPTCILQYISSKFPSIYNIQEKTTLQDMTQKFWQTVISNSIPTTERYIDDLHSTISSTFTHTNNQSMESANEQITSTNNQITVHQQAEQIYSNKYFKDPTTFLSSHEFLDFPMPYSNPPSWDEEDGHLSIQWLDKKFSECILLENSPTIDDLFQRRSPTFGDLFAIEKIDQEYHYPDIDILQVLKDCINMHTETNGMHETEKIDCTKEKFCWTQMRFIRPNENCRGSKLFCSQQGTHSTATLALDASRHMKCSHLAPPTRSCPTTQNFILGSTSNARAPDNSDIDIPSFSAITDSLKLVPVQEVPVHYQANFSAPGCSSILPKTNYESLVRNSNSNNHFLYSNSPLRSYHNSLEKSTNRFGTPISDPVMYQLLEDYEAECLLRDKALAEEPPMQNFSSASDLPISTQLNSNQVIFSTAAQAEFYKMMTSLLPHLEISQRIFQIDNVWVDQKTLTVSMRPGCWMNPHTLDCYSKMINTNLLNRGRQGLIPSNEPIVHIVGKEDMELLMRPLLNHSDPICADMLSEATVGFSLQNANFVHLPCFNDKQWIVITANFDSGKFFDIMNPDGSGSSKFSSIISAVSFNFKTLFAKTYPNCTAFNIREFDYRFVPVPRTHYRYDTGIFLLQILKTYRGMGVPGFTTNDLQALREIFLYEIATCSNSEVQLPLVKAFLQNHGFRLLR